MMNHRLLTAALLRRLNVAADRALFHSAGAIDAIPQRSCGSCSM
jgi:hypothetical protein